MLLDKNDEELPELPINPEVVSTLPISSQFAIAAFRTQLLEFNLRDVRQMAIMRQMLFDMFIQDRAKTNFFSQEAKRLFQNDVSNFDPSTKLPDEAQ